MSRDAHAPLPIHRAVLVGIALSVWLVVSCGRDAAAPHVAAIALTPGAARITAGDTVRLSAELTDDAGTPITGRPITFTSSDPSTATVTESGLVTGVRPGAVEITAASDEATAHAEVTVTAGAPARVEKVSGDAQSGVVSTRVAGRLAVRVLDRLGFAVGGAEVRWSATNGALLASAIDSTDASGVATATLTLPPKPGSSAITAAATGVDSAVRFTATAKWSTVRDDWTTYGHDAWRTSAASTNIVGPLHLLWKYTSPGVPSHGLARAQNALATSGGVFVRTSLSSGFGFGLSPAVDKVTLDGAHAWTYDMGTDADFGNWAVIRGNDVILNDDGIRYVDLTSGHAHVSLGVDTWGDVVADASGLWLANGAQIDGAGVFVGAYDATGHRTWAQNSFAKCRGAAAALDGGLALNQGTVFYAAAYNTGADSIRLPFASGVYAFAAATGARTAFKAATPYGRPSADADRVYLVENGNTLVARAQSDLHAVWSVHVSAPGMQAPVVANGLVIIATSSDVEAYHATTGAHAWSAAIAGAYTVWSSTFQGGKCGVITIPMSGGATTSMAAALGSGTLVVTANDGIHILSLANGRDSWHGAIAGVPSRVWNPVLVNDPTRGPLLYVVDFTSVYALAP